MSYKVVVKEEAFKDAVEATDWYDKKQIGLGERFWENTWSNLKYLEQYPLSHQFKYKENRELLIKDFPYVIVYRVENNTVIILAVASCKQHPSKKRKRK